MAASFIINFNFTVELVPLIISVFGSIGLASTNYLIFLHTI